MKIIVSAVFADIQKNASYLRLVQLLHIDGALRLRSYYEFVDRDVLCHFFNRHNTRCFRITSYTIEIR